LTIVSGIKPSYSHIAHGYQTLYTGFISRDIKVLGFMTGLVYTFAKALSPLESKLEILIFFSLHSHVTPTVQSLFVNIYRESRHILSKSRERCYTTFYPHHQWLQKLEELIPKFLSLFSELKGGTFYAKSISNNSAVTWNDTLSIM
jgi:hypothetical protein